MNRFCKYVIKLYGKSETIFAETKCCDDILDLYDVHESKHGFSPMLRSIDFMHQSWSNFPNA